MYTNLNVEYESLFSIAANTATMFMKMMNPHSTTKQQANIATIENYIL